MFIFALFSTLLIALRTRVVCDELGQDDLVSIPSPENSHGSILYVELASHGVRSHLVRRLLEHPRWTKQAYRSNDYSVIRRRQPRYKPDESRSYRSAVKDDEDDNEEEEEDEDEEDEVDENKMNDEAVDDEEEQDEDMNEETVGDATGNRAARSSYVPFGNGIGAHEKQESVRIRSAEEECEDGSTEAPQYYEYETELKNAASQDGCRFQEAFIVNMLCTSLLILLYI